MHCILHVLKAARSYAQSKITTFLTSPLRPTYFSSVGDGQDEVGLPVLPAQQLEKKLNGAGRGGCFIVKNKDYKRVAYSLTDAKLKGTAKLKIYIC